MENEHGPCALADDEVALPMTSLGSGVDISGPFMDGDAILYRISRRPRSARAAAFVTSREITPQLLGLLGGAVDEGVDRLAAHGPQTAFVSGFQPARDLFSERYYGRFERRIPIDDVEEDKVAASFKNGVLTVTLPKSERVQQRVKRIAINGK